MRLSCQAAVPLLRARLERLEEASEHGTVMLAAGFPGDGRIAVPVRVQVSYPAPKAPRFGVAVTARTSPALYPQFRGEIHLAGDGSAATVLTLCGSYQVPLGILGRAFDATAAHGIAPRGLEDLLDRLVADLLADVARQADATYRAGRAGD
jgi:hypothetical protein